jgi:hypothetical protein
MKVSLLALFFLAMNAQAAQVLKFADMKLLSQATTAQQVFDEAVNIAPNFGINQLDEGLKPYFNPANGKSELCVPTSFANFLTYQMGITHKLPISTNVPGVSSDLQSIDANALVTDLTKRCKTDLATGTASNNFMNCIGEAMQTYFQKDAKVERINLPFKDLNFPSYVEWKNRAPDLTDIQQAIKNGDVVLASVAWYKIDPTTQKWVTTSGHEFVIYGYGRENYFENNLLQLAVLDPEFIWNMTNTTSDYNLVMAIRRKDDPNSSIFLDGRGFNGQVSRGYLRSLTIIHL